MFTNSIKAHVAKIIFSIAVVDGRWFKCLLVYAWLGVRLTHFVSLSLIYKEIPARENVCDG